MPNIFAKAEIPISMVIHLLLHGELVFLEESALTTISLSRISDHRLLSDERHQLYSLVYKDGEKVGIGNIFLTPVCKNGRHAYEIEILNILKQ